MRLTGKDVCPSCDTVFEWGVIPNERNSVVSFIGLKTLCNNVESCRKAYDGEGYSITVKCPQCGCPFTHKENKKEKR